MDRIDAGSSRATALGLAVLATALLVLAAYLAPEGHSPGRAGPNVAPPVALLGLAAPALGVAAEKTRHRRAAGSNATARAEQRGAGPDRSALDALENMRKQRRDRRADAATAP